MKNVNRVFKKVYPVLGSLIVFIAAFGGVTPFSLFDYYQPKAPKYLK